LIGEDIIDSVNSQSRKERFESWLKEEFHPSRLFPSLIASSISSILTVIESVSYAVLIFSGVLASNISAGIAVALIAAGVTGLITSVTSSYPGAIAVPQNKIAPILALIAAAVVAGMPEGATPDQTFLTVIAAIVISSLVTGLFLAALGVFKLGGLIRFIPYPVIAGFLAGTGWLLLLGSIKAMTGIAVTFSSLPVLFEMDVFIKWLPGLAFALIAHTILRRYKHFLIMPSLLFTAFVTFYAVLFFTNTSVHEAREAGWLIHSTAEGGLWQFLTVKSLTQAQWPVIFAQAGSIATVLLVSAVAILLNSSALELASEQEMDLDRELKTAGVANIASGMAGGMVGFTSLTISGLVLKMGVKSRLVGLITAASCTAVLFFGATVIAYFPEPIVGGLLLFLGLEFLTEWVYDTGKELPKSDFVIVLIIVAVVGVFGFIQGVLVGVVVAIIMFVIKYSSVDVVKHVLTGSHHQSNVDRPPSHQNLLREKGEKVYILKLHGFIFFGTANNLLNQIRERARNSDLPGLKFVLLDFRDVTGIDTSAVISLIKMHQLAGKESFILVFTHLSDTILLQMERGGLIEEEDKNLYMFTDLDFGLEWCEDQLLISEKADLTSEKQTLKDYLEELFPGALEYDKLANYLERSEAPKGSYLIRQGDPADDLYFIESGKVTVLIELESGDTLRLRKMGAGTVVGELGLYLSQVRTASVVADEPSVIYRLSGEALKTMEEKNPRTAAAFHQFMVRLLAKRLINTDETLKVLLG